MQFLSQIIHRCLVNNHFDTHLLHPFNYVYNLPSLNHIVFVGCKKQCHFFSWSKSFAFRHEQVHGMLLEYTLWIFQKISISHSNGCPFFKSPEFWICETTVSLFLFHSVVSCYTCCLQTDALHLLRQLESSDVRIRYNIAMLQLSMADMQAAIKVINWKVNYLNYIMSDF